MYLTEKGLKLILQRIYPNIDFVHNKTVPNSGIKNRPDYRNDELMLIVEFDGYLHYTQSKTILYDEKKDRVYSEMGYKIIRIPYFIQISKETIKHLFGVNINIPQNYPHGFIDPKCVLPSDFCTLGIKRYKKDLENFSFIKNEIDLSLEEKIKEKGDERYVIF